MKILQVHNIFIGKTGEETVLEEERIILEKNGHQVVQFLKDNSTLSSANVFAKARLYSNLRNSEIVAKELELLIEKENPDICHVHNTFPLVTPVIYRVCNEMNVPVVKTLHNYKMVCTNSLMFRKGAVCEKCLNKSFYNSIKYKCYRDSYLATAIQANVLQHHRNSETWSRRVDAFFCLTEFQKDLLASGGLPASKLYVKPNFIKRDNSTVTYDDFFLFVGKVDDYKGLQDLLYLFERNIRSKFVVIGKADNQDIFNEFNNVDYLGEQGRDVVLDHMKRCRAVIFPSLYYEGMPMVILEAFSNSKAVVSRDRGAMSSMIIENYNGLKYEDVDKLVEIVEKLDAEKSISMRLGENAYLDYQNKYTEQKGYEKLIGLYSLVIKKKQR
ncbi:hypothetical protein BFP97_13530 [Roseivirga sp. 4D4]|uniref:glycosyltransferase family 4 protein n=1 Tax=Roseivirga sp. 4D4 TaxID=1889784 RepID=UPI000852E5E3|nr:glycosyltransferase family 4 protein [Roseivirga sp. 4D4]OEK02479.1 hypothetical protein BFP97_13530 [Roseivirga sp. 4D4]